MELREVSPYVCSLLEDGSWSRIYFFPMTVKDVQDKAWYGFFSSHSLRMDRDRLRLLLSDSCVLGSGSGDVLNM